MFSRISRRMWSGKSIARKLALLSGGAAAVVICLVVRWQWGPNAVVAEGPPPKQVPSAPAPKAETLEVVAVVNGSEVTRRELARDALRHYGEAVLESLVNRELIEQHCVRSGIQVTDQEIRDEVSRVARRFNIPADDWLRMLEQERGVTAKQYYRDIIWPSLALRKLANERLDVSDDELRAAYETQFGPAIEARLIACNDPQKARQTLELAQQSPDEFGKLAKQFSDDVHTASQEGRIPPIRLHLGEEVVEKAAFSLQPGQISEIIQVGSQHIFLKCESRIPDRYGEYSFKDPQVRQRLEAAILEKKERLMGTHVFDELRRTSVIKQPFGDPELSKQMPGVAALVNNRQISLMELAEECIQRHGTEVLENTINQRILQQACKEKEITVTWGDLHAEIHRAMESMGYAQDQGKMDLEQWYEIVAKEQGISKDKYIYDIVWPTVALKMLVGADIQVSDEDIQRGYEANYGPRAICRAIVFADLRQAEKVWRMARETPTVENFGELAAEYSIEPSSKALRGEVAPLRRHGGQPLLEEAAFSLKPNELSSIVQVDDKFVILFLEGFTQPVNVSLGEVRPMIAQDVREKKLRLEMAQRFTNLTDQARIENFLAGTRHVPQTTRTGTPRVGSPETPPRR